MSLIKNNNISNYFIKLICVYVYLLIGIFVFFRDRNYELKGCFEIV